MTEPSKSDRIVAKIKRLLRLATSESVGEAANAAAAAQRLMAQYEIELDELGDLYDDDDDDPNIDTLKGDDGLYRGQKVPFWVLRLASCLADLNHCTAFMQVIPTSKTVCREHVVCVAGSPVNLSVVNYMFRYLESEIRSLCKQYAASWKESTGYAAGTKWRNDFKLGATDQVILRMRDAREDIFQNANPRTLMRLDAIHQASKKWLEDNKTEGTPNRSAPRPSLSGYIAGQHAGRKIELKAEQALPEGDN